MKKVMLISLIGALLVGCVSSPVSIQKSKPVPQERILAFSEQNPSYAKVTIIRDSGLQGSGCYLAVMYKQTTLARFGTSERADFYLPEGTHNFAVTPDPDGRGLCASGLGFNPVIEERTISKDKENLFRISLGPWRRPRLLPM